MHRKKICWLFILLLVCTMVMSGCVRYDNLKQHTIIRGNDFINYYILREGNKNKENLIVYIGGSGYGSVLGLKEDGRWKETTLAYTLHNTLLSDFDILIPEKMNIKMGKNHRNERKILENYTLDQRVATAILVIDKYLKRNLYENVILLGFSEGGYILPRIYLNLKNQNKISGLAVLACGGLSQYESFKILSNKNYSYPEGYKMELKRIEQVAKDIKKNPDNINKRFLGLAYKRWSTFMFYRSLDDLVEIDIPIFMGQGEKDMMSAVESARIVEKKFSEMKKNNLTYVEYQNKRHGFNGEFEPIIMDIKQWFEGEQSHICF